ncbi:hypothetical protein DCAR_0415527 [Daucus carota subsp. sativus]|uniref:Uncharacterized protein n=1 Tax=Daucus carota subsp. sativus TaxID=79200 RepID=A0A165WD66_DAUCS|nr:hypothetical protein DCAR_0415527 [Daucus carota subsp. sativus]
MAALVSNKTIMIVTALALLIANIVVMAAAANQQQSGENSFKVGPPLYRASRN